MPSKKKKYNARFPAGRIKKIMQTDEEVGKVAQAVPIIISRTLELFVESLLKKTIEITNAKNAKTLTPSHMKQCILSESRFDFLADLVKNIPDAVNEEDEISNPIPAPVRRRNSVKSESNNSKPSHTNSTSHSYLNHVSQQSYVPSTTSQGTSFSHPPGPTPQVQTIQYAPPSPYVHSQYPNSQTAQVSFSNSNQNYSNSHPVKQAHPEVNAPSNQYAHNSQQWKPSNHSIQNLIAPSCHKKVKLSGPSLVDPALTSVPQGAQTIQATAPQTSQIKISVPNSEQSVHISVPHISTPSQPVLIPPQDIRISVPQSNQNIHISVPQLSVRPTSQAFAASVPPSNQYHPPSSNANTFNGMVPSYTPAQYGSNNLVIDEDYDN